LNICNQRQADSLLTDNRKYIVAPLRLTRSAFLCLILVLTACGSSSAVECLLAKEEVASSNLVFRSIKANRFEPKRSQTFTKIPIFSQQLLDEFLKARPQGITARSVSTYHYTLDKFIGCPITATGINEYLSALTCSNGKLKFYSCLKALCNWLHRNEFISRNPIDSVPVPKTQKKIMPSITKEQQQVLLDSCRCDRDRAFISLLWYSGMRIAEAVNITASDFNWAEGTVIVLGKGNRFRKALAGNGVVKSWFTNHDTFEISMAGAKVMLRRLGQYSGIHCNAHSFRRGFCVEQVKSGLSTRVVQSLGGWESISMVERYSKSLTFDESLRLYHLKNEESFTVH
jgi:site-specific recombinase XerD